MNQAKISEYRNDRFDIALEQCAELTFIFKVRKANRAQSIYLVHRKRCKKLFELFQRKGSALRLRHHVEQLLNFVFVRQLDVFTQHLPHVHAAHHDCNPHRWKLSMVSCQCGCVGSHINPGGIILLHNNTLLKINQRQNTLLQKIS